MFSVEHLPTLNALLNSTCAVLLLAGFGFIRRKNVRAHRACMLGALAVSVLFLAGYLTYHFQTGTTHFTGTGIVRPVYFTILTTHTPLAIAIVPMALITLRLALKRRFSAHRRMARWTLPIWLYVSVTGVLVYLMLYLWYPS
ncbi:MAG: DUF420 domain-containing protein [Armatimonadetes bacterium]|nr:DUF420 domain-containing protein [Armatimonadota bacterium]